MERLVKNIESEGKQNCPAFYDEDGFQLYAAVLEAVLNPILRCMQRDRRHKDGVSKELEVEYWIRLARSPRMGDLNEVTYQVLEDSVIKLIHRWEFDEKIKRKQPGFDMMQHYAVNSYKFTSVSEA